MQFCNLVLQVTFLKSEAICVLIRYADVEGGYESFHSFEFSTKTPFLTFLKGLLSRVHNEKIPKKVWSFQNRDSKKVLSWKWAIIDQIEGFHSIIAHLFYRNKRAKSKGRAHIWLGGTDSLENWCAQTFLSNVLKK